MQQQRLADALHPCPVCGHELWINAPRCHVCGWRKQPRILKAIIFTGRQFFQSKQGQMSLFEQVVMYFGLMLGVVFSAELRGTRSATTPILAALTALVISPVAFEKLKIAPESPFIVRFGLFVQNGVFWDILFEAIGSKLVGPG